MMCGRKEIIFVPNCGSKLLKSLPILIKVVCLMCFMRRVLLLMLWGNRRLTLSGLGSVVISWSLIKDFSHLNKNTLPSRTQIEGSVG